jgi:hypothetical protein
VQVKSGIAPGLGELLYLIPRHVCPTVNNFDCALLVRNGQIDAVEEVSARGHETPLLQAEGMSHGKIVTETLHNN